MRRAHQIVKKLYISWSLLKQSCVTFIQYIIKDRPIKQSCVMSLVVSCIKDPVALILGSMEGKG